METSLETAKSFFKQNKHQGAIDACHKILATDSNSIEALKLIAKSFLATRKIEDARLYLKKALKIQSDDYEVIKDLGNTYKALGDSNSAKNYYQQAIAINGSYAPALTNLGIVELNTGNKQEALSLLIKATKSDPELAQAWGNLAKGYIQLGKTQEAETSCRNSIKLNPNLLSPHFLLATILVGKNKLQEAERSLRKTIEIKPDFFQAHLSLGSVLRDLGQLKAAEISTLKAIEINPDLFKAHLLLSKILLDQELPEKLPKAEESIRKVIELQPNYSQGYSILGAILNYLGKPQEAEISARKAIEINPDFANYHYNLGRILIEIGNLKEAEISLCKAIHIKPCSDFYFTYANCLFEKKEFDSSIDNLYKARELVVEKSTLELLIEVSIIMAKSAKKLSIDFSKTNKNRNLFDKRVDRLIINREVEDELLSYLNTIKTNKLESTKDSRYGNGVCSDFKLFDDTSPVIKKLSNDIEKVCKKELGLKQIVFCDSFFNIFISGSGQPSHFHIKMQDKHFNLAAKKYSLVYYLEIGDQDCEAPGILRLHEPEEDILPKKGMIIIIGAERFHSVVYRGNKKRVMIGVNFYGI